MKQWSEQRAWKFLAPRWDKAKPNRYGAYVMLFGQKPNGLCDCVFELWYRERITDETWDAMVRRMRRHRPASWRKHNPYWWGTTPADARRRAAFCRKMAKLAAKEESDGRKTLSDRENQLSIQPIG